MELTRPRTATATPRWSSLLIRGVLSIIFGAIALALPGVTLRALTIMFVVYAITDGIVALVVAVQRGQQPNRGLLVLDGIVGIGAGVVTLLWPAITLLALVLLIAARFTIEGVLQVVASIRLRHELQSPVLYGLAGAASIAFGLLTFSLPGLTAVVLVWMLGAYAVAFGVLLLTLAIRLRSSQQTRPPTGRGAIHAPA